MNSLRADRRANFLKNSDVSDTHPVSILRERDHFPWEWRWCVPLKRRRFLNNWHGYQPERSSYNFVAVKAWRRIYIDGWRARAHTHTHTHTIARLTLYEFSTQSVVSNNQMIKQLGLVFRLQASLSHHSIASATNSVQWPGLRAAIDTQRTSSDHSHYFRVTKSAARCSSAVVRAK
jgi:hypothetical protein